MNNRAESCGYLGDAVFYTECGYLEINGIETIDKINDVVPYPHKMIRITALQDKFIFLFLFTINGLRHSAEIKESFFLSTFFGVYKPVTGLWIRVDALPSIYYLKRFNLTRLSGNKPIRK